MLTGLTASFSIIRLPSFVASRNYLISFIVTYFVAGYSYDRAELAKRTSVTTTLTTMSAATTFSFILIGFHVLSVIAE
jgi:biotin transporter BioY